MRSILVLLAIWGMVLSKGHEWRVETVDSIGNVGWWNSMALDALGNPHISYLEYGLLDLKYAHWDGIAWQIERVDSSGPVGGYTSLVLDSTGNPHISYYHYYRDLRYARRSGTVWHIETVDSLGDIGRYTSLALDRNGCPHISYYDESRAFLKYARWNGTDWEFEIADSTCGQFTCLALDSRENPHVCYYDSVGLNLKYAHRDSTGWENEAVDFMGDLADITISSLALDSDDFPHISYYHYSDSLGIKVVDQKYAHWDGAEWRIQIVDSAGSLGKYSSIVLDESGRPCISYRDTSNDDLKFAVWTGTAWQTEVVDTAGGGPNSLVLDDSGRVHVCYYISSVDDLKYAVGVPQQAVQEESLSVIFSPPAITIVRGALQLAGEVPAGLLDITGRKVMELAPGENDIRHLSPGVYFLKAEGGRIKDVTRTAKVVIQK